MATPLPMHSVHCRQTCIVLESVKLRLLQRNERTEKHDSEYNEYVRLSNARCSDLGLGSRTSFAHTINSQSQLQILCIEHKRWPIDVGACQTQRTWTWMFSLRAPSSQTKVYVDCMSVRIWNVLGAWLVNILHQSTRQRGQGTFGSRDIKTTLNNIDAPLRKSWL